MKESIDSGFVVVTGSHVVIDDEEEATHDDCCCCCWFSVLTMNKGSPPLLPTFEDDEAGAVAVTVDELDEEG